jgi:hypothetical protein
MRHTSAPAADCGGGQTTAVSYPYYAPPFKFQEFLLKVHWSFAIAILCLVPALQLTVLLAIVFFANDTVVKDDSHLCVARLLAPVVNSLKDRGSLLSVGEVVERLGKDTVRLRYGWDEIGGTKRVRILEDESYEEKCTRAIGSRVKSCDRRFPEGKYD